MLSDQLIKKSIKLILIQDKIEIAECENAANIFRTLKNHFLI
jgi:hypothetical protein